MLIKVGLAHSAGTINYWAKVYLQVSVRSGKVRNVENSLEGNIYSVLLLGASLKSEESITLNYSSLWRATVGKIVMANFSREE